MELRENKFITEDKRFGLTLRVSILQRILDLCASSNGMETGGILVGFYSPKHDDAIVTDISIPPSDSKRSRASFVRGTAGLQVWLNALWTREQQFYLGEWHFHPSASPHPSADDIQQMRFNAEKENLQCPEPVLLIVGGTPPHEWSVSAFVSPRGQRSIEMMPMNTHDGAMK